MSRALQTIAKALVRELEPMRFSAPVTHVYNPWVYAWKPYSRYVTRYGQAPKEVLLLGMNPGPFGMAQTGVPFGEVGLVRDWLGIEAPVGKPDHEHPKRPVDGFACARSEVSGQRLWSWAKERFGKPEKFFARFWIHNYCPLAFMEESGRNVTPDKLKAQQRAPLMAACDGALRAVVEHLRPKMVIGVGQWAEKRAREALGDDAPVEFGRIPHPSPASPLANRGWAPAADKAFAALGVRLPR